VVLRAYAAIAPVSIHAPVQGATVCIGYGRLASGFNPRPCARGDTIRIWAVVRVPVSIHAPVQGATRNRLAGLRCLSVSIHAPVQGATAPGSSGVEFGQFQSTPLCKGRHCRRHSGQRRNCFNPRPCARGDRIAQRVEFLCRVSIHAPVQGATRYRLGFQRVYVGFNPRPCARGDPASFDTYLSVMFQSTPLCKGRPAIFLNAFPIRSSFNPRPCARGDRRIRPRCRVSRRFNPRPCARGDLAVSQESVLILTVSIHAPVQGATQRGPVFALEDVVSIHAPVQGATLPPTLLLL